MDIDSLIANDKLRLTDSVVNGIVAAGVQLAVGELAATVLPRSYSPMLAVGRALINIMPGPLVDVVVAVAEDWDKPLLLGGIVGGAGALGGFAGWLAHRAPLGGGLLMLGSGTLAAWAAATRPDSAALPSGAAAVIGAAAGGATLTVLTQRPQRRFRAALLPAVGSLAYLARQRAVAQKHRLRQAQVAVSLPPAPQPLAPPAADTAFDTPGISPLLTPGNQVYVTDVTAAKPVVDPATWRLRIGGLVQHPISFTLDDLLALPLIEVDATLVCVHNPVGGKRVGTARWRGVPVVDLLNRAGVQPGADQLLTRSVDGFTAGVPLDLLRDDRPALVALGMNGEPLSVEHGFPARLLVPGIYGYHANTKWLAELEVTTFAAATDTWTRVGWPRRSAPVQPQARIDVPRHRATIRAGEVEIAGVAWHPPTGITGVDVRVDDAPWQPAELAEPLAPTTWRHWRYAWRATPGRHTIRVRTHSALGLQTADRTPPYPHGAQGYHTISLTVVPEEMQLPDAIWRSRIDDRRAELRQRIELAAQGLRAWLRYGFPRRPAFDD